MNRENDNWTAVLRTVCENWPLERWQDVGVVVGCSGGADSVALLLALDQLSRSSVGSTERGFLVAAHYDHGTRGKEGSGDAAFVRKLADERGVRFVHEQGVGRTTDEASLREQRYDFLIRAAKQTGARYIALAHSLDDNVETVLHHLMRGTGPSGMTGIPPIRVASNHPEDQDYVIVRPLLTARSALIRRSLSGIGQSWREDGSNQDNRYRRNWIRRELIPLIETQYPHASEAIGRAIDSHREWRDTITRLADGWIAEHVVNRDPLTIRQIATGAHIDASDAVVIHALQKLWQERQWATTHMNQASWQRIAKTMVATHPQRYSLPGDIDVVTTSGNVTLTLQANTRRS